jgi:hypothetical protein
MRSTGLFILVALLLRWNVALADDVPPAIIFEKEHICLLSSGDKVVRPPGVFFPAPTMAVVATEIQRLQQAELVLQAENAFLKAKVEAKYKTPLKALGVALLVGVAVGAGVALGVGH